MRDNGFNSVLIVLISVVCCCEVRSQSLPVIDQPPTAAETMAEKQLTFKPSGHILTNIGVWTPDSQWIVYDVRSDPEGAVFDGNRIEKVHVATREVVVLYEARNGAKCGVATCSPVEDKVVFILGPEHPTTDWQYAPNHRQGAVVDASAPGKETLLDACDITPPFTPGALRGGSHVHVFSGDGRWVSFTYQDHVLAKFTDETATQQMDLRNVGVSVPIRRVQVSKDHARNHDGSCFSVLVTRTTAHPEPGSDEISKAFEDAWVGRNGYRRSDGGWQERALAFQGHVLMRDGRTVAEAFIVDIPEDVSRAGDGPLEGTETLRPLPPAGTVQRRLTYTTDRKYPGLQGPRHWLRSSPDGTRIAILMKDDAGVVQLYTVSPLGGSPVQITRSPMGVASAFSWSPDGKRLAHVMDNSVFVTEVETGQSVRLTERSSDSLAPRPEACVFSPDGRTIAYVRTVATPAGESHNQIFVVSVPVE
jgi:hypothetical protein